MQRSVAYTLAFATAICVVCGVVVSTAAVQLADRQQANARLDKNRKVLEAAGLAEPGARLAAEEVAERFAAIEAKVIELGTGAEAPEIDPAIFDQQEAASDPERSRRAPRNRALVQRVPEHALVYELRDGEGRLEKVILPVEGKGLWSTLYGFIALESDLQTVGGLIFYAHKETPGLGGEVDNPSWKAKWPGRKVFGEEGEPEIRVIKGAAGPPSEAPHRVDGLSGATITSRGVTHLLHFWLGENGFLPYLERLGEETEERAKEPEGSVA